jgi:hypothetical protein
MPCYERWDEYLKPGSPEYIETRTKLQAQQRAVEHIIDHYYAVAGRLVSDPLPATEPRADAAIVEQIVHHMDCDDIRFTTLYDIGTLLNADDSRDAPYARVISLCAERLRILAFADRPGFTRLRCAQQTAASEAAQRWQSKGMCAVCGIWVYLYAQGSIAEHCGKPLISSQRNDR